MAKYNTFVVFDCKRRCVELVTSSARKASKLLSVGHKVEVWNDNQLLETIRERDRRREKNPLGPYIALEREYIGKKQAAAEKRNRARAYYANNK